MLFKSDLVKMAIFGKNICLHPLLLTQILCFLAIWDVKMKNQVFWTNSCVPGRFLKKHVFCTFLSIFGHRIKNLIPLPPIFFRCREKKLDATGLDYGIV